MITYKSFIKDVTALRDEAKILRESSDTYHGNKFKRWRNALQGTLNQIVQADYLLPCPVKARSRKFGRTQRIITDAGIIKLFQIDIDDTINELDFIIDSYYKHGEPPKSNQTSSTDLKYPEKVTVKWLIHHAPINLWLTTASILIFVFIIGTQVGSSDIYEVIIKAFSESKK